MQNMGLTNIIESINKEMQKTFSAECLCSLFEVKTSSDSSYVQEALETHILSPCLDIMNRGGKRLRPLLSILFTQMLSGDEEAAYKFSSIIEGIHTASLIHDDIEDASIKRRGKECAHIKWGVDVCINAASALYFFAMNLIEEQKPSYRLPLYRACTSSLSLLHLGQAMDIKQHSNYNLPFSYEMYEKMASLKTGTLFSLAMKAALIFSYTEGDKENERQQACNALNELGVAFQMFDDLVNISSGNKGKDRGDDVVEGKLSFPVVLYLEKAEQNKECILHLFERAKKEGITSSAVNECCILLEESGIVQEGVVIAKEKTSHAFATLQAVFGKKVQLDTLRHLFGNSVSKVLGASALC